MSLLLIGIMALGFLVEVSVPDFSGSWKQSNEQCSPKRTAM
jgi:hypothetical protein